MYPEPHVPAARTDRTIPDDEEPFLSWRGKVLLALLCCLVASSCGYLLKSASSAPEQLHAQQTPLSIDE
ncbi:MAG: hypothetical protein HUJ26_18165 [Planctomycetaceae bacterium]|nr:hypothetical protein [Planctomycetaceae bacterium]